jgi:FMN reductase
MTGIRLVGISGNIRRPSRTRALVEHIGYEAVRSIPARVDIYDLIDAGPGLGRAFAREELSPQAAAIVAAIEAADALIVGSPVYKGSYTGLFKHLFDFIEIAALAGKPVVLTATGAAQEHALVVEHQLRPLFGFFTALALPTAVYASDQDFSDGRLVSERVRDRAAEAIRQLAATAGVDLRGGTTRRAAGARIAAGHLDEIAMTPP